MPRARAGEGGRCSDHRGARAAAGAVALRFGLPACGRAPLGASAGSSRSRLRQAHRQLPARTGTPADLALRGDARHAHYGCRLRAADPRVWDRGGGSGLNHLLHRDHGHRDRLPASGQPATAPQSGDPAPLRLAPLFVRVAASEAGIGRGDPVVRRWHEPSAGRAPSSGVPANSRRSLGVRGVKGALLTEKVASSLLAAIVLVSCAVALAWVFYVPMFEAPDEAVHFEYSTALYSAGGLVAPSDVAHMTVPAGRPVPYPTYLEDQSGVVVIAEKPDVKAPAGYGTAPNYP